MAGATWNCCRLGAHTVYTFSLPGNYCWCSQFLQKRVSQKGWVNQKLYLHFLLLCSSRVCLKSRNSSMTPQDVSLLGSSVSVQFSMVSMRSEKPICAPPRLKCFPKVAFETVPLFVWLTMALSRPFKGRSSNASSFHDSLLQAVDGVMSSALCPQVVSQATQHFRYSEKQATGEGCFCPPVRLLGHIRSLRHDTRRQAERTSPRTSCDIRAVGKGHSLPSLGLFRLLSKPLPKGHRMYVSRFQKGTECM